MSDSRKADHPFEGLADCPYSGACHYILADGRPCWLTKAEHEAHPEPEPEPAPESPEDRVRAKVESIGRDEARRRIEAFCAEPDPAPEPCDSFPPEAITAPGEDKVTITAAPDPLRRLAEESMTRIESACEVPEHHAPWCVCVQSCLESIFEGVVREAAQLAGEGGVAGALQRWGLSPESAPEGKP